MIALAGTIGTASIFTSKSRSPCLYEDVTGSILGLRKGYCSCRVCRAIFSKEENKTNVKTPSPAGALMGYTFVGVLVSYVG